MELTREEIDVIICLLDDMYNMSGLKPEELELKETLERWGDENENKFNV
jgi:hypothetical protein